MKLLTTSRLVISVLALVFCGTLVAGCETRSSKAVDELARSVSMSAEIEAKHVAKAQLKYYAKHGRFTNNLMNLNLISELKASENIEVKTDDEGQSARVNSSRTDTISVKGIGGGERVITARADAIVNAGDTDPSVNVTVDIENIRRDSGRRSSPMIIFPDGKTPMIMP